jgi:hypothetical protein
MEKSPFSYIKKINPFQKQFDDLYEVTVKRNWKELESLWKTKGREHWIQTRVFKDDINLKHLSNELQYTFFAWCVRYGYLEAK